jgi:DNA-binding NtrC family response regulator
MSTAPGNKVLIIDDERPILMTLEALLTRHGYRVESARTAALGLELAASREAPDLILLDIGLPDASGLDVLTKVKQTTPAIQIIVLTAQDSLSNAIQSIKLGAFHFISKPYAPEELLSLMQRACEQQELVRETHSLREETKELKALLKKAESQRGPVFKNRRMVEIEELISQIAPSEANVLVTGESGVGKEVVANLMHARSRRAAGPLVKLNCAALPQHLIEGELFGYVKGAFTGAVNDFPGMIAAAAGGTLFLDEIAEMPATLQTRFLRVLQEREFRPLGSTKTLKADFRLVAATNQSITRALREGMLRPDLYYRINTFQIEIPPLRERREDIAPLVALFVKRYAQQMGRPEPQITADALARLRDFSWPGNVRQLQNAIEYAVVLAKENVINDESLPPELLLPAHLRDHVASSSFAGAAPNGTAPQGGGAALADLDTLNLDDRERHAILQALAQTHGNKLKAARILGIHRPTLYNKMKRYGIAI